MRRGGSGYAYHSCRNRHCPKCQSTATAAWVAARRKELLPVPYFHNVFTLPHELNGLILYSQRNQRALLKLLFDAAAQTLWNLAAKSWAARSVSRSCCTRGTRNCGPTSMCMA